MLKAYAQSPEGYLLLESLPDIEPSGGGLEYLTGIYNIALTVSVLLAVIMIVIAGVQYSTSWASPSNKSAAKDKIWSAIGGLVLALLSVLILNTINPDILGGTVSIVSAPSGPSGGGVGGKIGGTKCTGTDCHTEDSARALLKQYDIGTKGICPPGVRTSCVNLDGVRKEALIEAIWIKESCKCEIFITGATEDGHSSGHTNGYKIDIRPTPELIGWVEKNMRPAGQLGHDAIWVNDKAGVGGNGAGWMLEDVGTNNAHFDIDIRGAQNALHT
ncbi:MAG TPA: pilin [Candidatus Paceibacterota bacterium]